MPTLLSPLPGNGAGNVGHMPFPANHDLAFSSSTTCICFGGRGPLAPAAPPLAADRRPTSFTSSTSNPRGKLWAMNSMVTLPFNWLMVWAKLSAVCASRLLVASSKISTLGRLRSARAMAVSVHPRFQLSRVLVGIGFYASEPTGIPFVILLGVFLRRWRQHTAELRLAAIPTVMQALRTTPAIDCCNKTHRCFAGVVEFPVLQRPELDA